MKIATITDTKNKLSALLDIVRHGECVLIMDRGCPVARLEPAAGKGGQENQGRTKRLERQGMLSRARNSIRKGFFAEELPKPGKDGSILKALLDERAEGR
jgi:prevent-host-death family protein